MGGDLKDIWKVIVAAGIITLMSVCIVAVIASKIKETKDPLEDIDFTEGVSSINYNNNELKGFYISNEFIA